MHPLVLLLSFLFSKPQWFCGHFGFEYTQQKREIWVRSLLLLCIKTIVNIYVKTLFEQYVLFELN